MARSVLKPHAAMFAALFRVCDPVFTVIVGVFAYRAYPSLGTFSLPDHYLFFLAAGALAVAAVFPAFSLYEPHRGASIAEELRRLTVAWLVIAALTGAGIFATKLGDAYSRVWVGAWLLVGYAATFALRIVVRGLLRSLRVRGLNQRHIAIVGAGTLGRTVATRLRQSPWAGFSIFRFYDDDAALAGTAVAARPVMATDPNLLADVAAGHVDQVWLALPLHADLRIRQILTMLRDHPVEVRFVPDIYSFHLLNHSVTEVAGLPVITLTETPMSGINRVVKAIEDYALAVVLVALLSPAMLAIAAGVRLSSKGPVLYRQQRVTWGGEVFEMLKFRTMPVTAEEASGPVWARRTDRRATPFGTFLRRTSLDELPQLLNVLRGEMSLVGPRPERPQFVEQFRSQIPGYMQKHLVKAGITGWAQVNDLRGDSDLAQRIQYDLFYIDNWSLWFDLRILFRTLWHILTSRNAG
jgi:putative colanic acid biosynthesis UDP-glucose lipid carrier transferase